MRRKLGYALLAVVALLAVAFAALRTPDTDPVAMRAKYGAPPSQFLDLGGGLTVHLRDTGPRTAPALMLIHGSNASLHTWEAWAERLDGRYRVIRIDLPGHGLTGADPARDYGASAFAATVEKVRARLGIGRMVVVGSSMGGGVAWHYALAYPGRVAALVLVDSVGAPMPANSRPPLVFRIVQTPVLRNLALVVTPRSLVEKGLKSAFFDPSRVTDPMVERSWELLRYPGNRQATLDRADQPNDGATSDQLRSLKMPVLILWGANDRLIPRSSADWLHAHIPGSTLRVYPATGHVLMEEHPDASAADLDRWLNGITPAPDHDGAADPAGPTRK